MEQSITYRIAKWHETFETADSRRHKQLTWISMPIDRQSSGYQSMIDSFPDDSASIYGAWVALLTIAAQCPERGTLASGKGEPHTIERLARMAHMPTEVFRRLFAWASQEKVGWLLSDQETTSVEPVTDQPPNDIPNTTKPNPTQPKNNAAKSPRTEYPDWFEEFWNEYPPNDKGRKRGKSKTYKLAQRLADESRSDLILAAKNYADEQVEFIRDPERFLKEDWWADWVEKIKPKRFVEVRSGISEADRARIYLIKEKKISEARDWSDERLLLEYERLKNK